MTTPICSFAAKYAAGDPVRLHMPGHKGVCDPRDITEITGADVLYHAYGVIRESEENAASLFGTGADGLFDRRLITLHTGYGLSYFAHGTEGTEGEDTCGTECSQDVCDRLRAA